MKQSADGADGDFGIGCYDVVTTHDVDDYLAIVMLAQLLYVIKEISTYNGR